jgi:hypothetical protein
MHKLPHLSSRRRLWILAVLLIVLVAGHGAVLYYLSAHVVLSAAVLSGAIIVLVTKHVGLLGPLYALFRRRRSGRTP